MMQWLCLLPSNGRQQNRVSVPPCIPTQWLCVTGISTVSSHSVTVQLSTRCLVERFLDRLHNSGYDLIMCVWCSHCSIFTVSATKNSDYVVRVVVTVPSRWLIEWEFHCVELVNLKCILMHNPFLCPWQHPNKQYPCIIITFYVTISCDILTYFYMDYHLNF